jgi:FAD/FMN-containing dehydrogenase
MTPTRSNVRTALRDRLEGQVLAAGDAGYDEARRVWNAMIDRRPAVIARCQNLADVVAAVRTARDHDLEIGVYSGGHSVLGLPVPQGGLTIDLRPMAAVEVDPDQRRARVQGGALLGALDRATQPYGLATTAGNVSHTGVGGLTLGGGMGWLARRFGLSCDNVLGFEVVTAAGEVLRATAEEHPDLHWGLRGGGGNFGIVTEFEFGLHEVGTAALSVELVYPAGDAAEVLAGWRDLARTAPREATFAVSVSGGLATAGYVWVGDPEAGRALVPALRSLGTPIAERVVELSYLELQTREDTVRGHHLRRYWKGHYLRELPDAAIEVLLEQPAGFGGSLQAYGGAIADVADDATAFGQRETAFEYVGAARWTDPAEDSDRIAQARTAAARLAPYASGVYVNVLTDEGADGVRRAYPPAKLARLTALKDRYDPDNVFHLNQNIQPSQAS